MLVAQSSRTDVRMTKLNDDGRAQEKKICHCLIFFLFWLPWSDGTRCHDLRFWMLNFKPVFSLSFFTFIKRLFSSCLLSAIRVVSSAYLSLLTFLPTILIPACASSSQAFHTMYSANKLNEQGNSIQPWYTSLWILNQFIVLVQFWLLLLALHTTFSGGR